MTRHMDMVEYLIPRASEEYQDRLPVAVEVASNAYAQHVRTLVPLVH